MLPSFKTLVSNLSEKNRELEEENRMLKKKLQFRHTEINDLRYTKKLLQRQLDNMSN